MIPVLYEHNETTFTSFGIGVLKDTTSCLVTEERNGTYELVLKYPINGSLYSEITKERIVRVQVNDNKSIQAFRIYRITAPISGTVTIYAQHISYDLSGVSVMPFTLTGNPTVLMNKVFSQADCSTNFSFQTNISGSGKLEFKEPRTIRSLLGSKENSLLALFGGEFEWDNFIIKLRSARGSDNGISILYGKNLTKLEHNSDLSDVYTHLCPYAIYQDDNGDDVTLKLTEKVLPIVTTSNVNKTLIKDFSSEMKDLEKTEANLRTVANAYLTENVIGIETPNITLSFEELRNQLGYSNLQERINLCDLVTVKYPELGVNVKTKIVKVVYDTLKEKFKTITLGAIKASLEDRVSNLEKGAEETTKIVEAVPSAIQKAVDDATDVITGANGGCIVLNLDNNAKPYEFLIMNDDDIQDATKVWRWNINGLGYSPNGYNGPYTTAITADGKIVADFITAGTLNADVIKAGTIQGTNGNSYWDLVNDNLHIEGEIYATSGAFSNCTINDSCNIYGNLWIEGEFDATFYTDQAHVEFTTRIGGDMFITDVTKTISGEYAFNSTVYITPLGFIDVPEISYSYDEVMFFGVTDSPYNLSQYNVRSGLYISDKNYYPSGGDAVRETVLYLCIASTTVLKYVHNEGERPKCQIGIGFGHNYLIGDLCMADMYNYNAVSAISPKYYNQCYYGLLKEHWALEKHLYFGDDFSSSNYLGNISISNTKYPKMYGSWYASTINFGNGSGYQIMMDNDQITFKYGSTEVGDIECYSTYVDIQGTWKTNGSAWISSSDEKVKNTIEELDNKYSVLFSNLRPVSYKYNEGTSGRKHTGFIAQEVVASMKEAGIPLEEYGLACAFGDPNDPKTEWGLRYEELIALCVKEIQRLNKRVDELEGKK